MTATPPIPLSRFRPHRVIAATGVLRGESWEVTVNKCCQSGDVPSIWDSMSTLSDAFDAPIIFREGGLDLKLPRLDIDDIALWLEELAPAMRAERLKAIAGNAPFAERQRLTALANERPTLGDIADLLYSPAGIKAAIDKSLAKGGMADAAERAATVKLIKPGRLQKLAMDISGLFDKTQLNPLPEDKKKEDGAGPLPPAGESPSGDGNTSAPAAGLTPDASSASTPAASPSAA